MSRPCRSSAARAHPRDPRTWSERGRAPHAGSEQFRVGSDLLHIRNAVESEATAPNSGSCSRTAPRSETHSPPSASITARSRITLPGSWPRRRCLTDPSPPDRPAVEPVLSATWHQAVPARDTSPAPSASTSTVTTRPLCITFKVNPPSSGFRTSAIPRIPARPDGPAPSAQPEGASLTARSGLRNWACRGKGQVRNGPGRPDRRHETKAGDLRSPWLP